MPLDFSLEAPFGRPTPASFARHARGRRGGRAAVEFSPDRRVYRSSRTGRSAAAAGVVAIRNATILTVTRGTIQNGTIVMRDGKIAAVGTNVQVPEGATVVDGTGKFVSPGIIDAHSHIANDAINEGATAVSSMTGMGDVLNPTDIAIQRDLAGGLTVANILHGSANPIGGKTRRHQAALGREEGRGSALPGRAPRNQVRARRKPEAPGRAGAARAAAGIRRRARASSSSFAMRSRARRRTRRPGRTSTRPRPPGSDVLQPRRDLQLDALVEILEGKRLVHVHCYRADEILMMIRLAEEMGFKVATFQHVLEGYKVAKEIAAHGAGGSTFSDWWGYKIEAEDAIPGNAAIMTRKGVTVSINSDSAEHARRLNTEAAKSVRWGDMTDDQAMAMVTMNPARQLRIDQRVGSLEVGKDADVVIWSHHPLSTYAIVEKTYIDGIAYYDRVQELRGSTWSRRRRRRCAGGLRGGGGGRSRSGRRPQREGGWEAAPTPRICSTSRASRLTSSYNGDRPDVGDHERAHRAR